MAEDFEVRGKVGGGVEEGSHTGKIVEVSRRPTENKKTGETYDYTRISLSVDDTKGQDGKPIVINTDFPTTVSDKSGLGQLMSSVTGEPIENGKTYNPAKILTGVAVKFVVETDENGFARVVKKTLKKR